MNSTYEKDEYAKVDAEGDKNSSKKMDNRIKNISMSGNLTEEQISQV